MDWIEFRHEDLTPADEISTKPRAARREVSKGIASGWTVVEKDRLDLVTRVNIKAFLAIYIPAIALLVYFSFDGVSPLSASLYIGAGYVGWTLFEYWIHRLVLHWAPRHPFLSTLHWMGHGHHHAHPRDPYRLIFPLIFSVPILAGTAVMFELAFGFSRGMALEAGWVLGYALMDTIHYSMHHRRPSSRMGRLLHTAHMRHHFQEGSHGFGIASPWWDYLFRTTYSASQSAQVACGRTENNKIPESPAA
jgi:sterol desaturase/sphingolipid hydroxylase (fatty acid hydroxylase superfamily)